MEDTLVLRGELIGHGGWVTAIATTGERADRVISSSRDHSVIVWQLNSDHSDGKYGYPKQRLTGHSHFVQDVSISSDGQFALSGSWDGTLRLWDLTTGRTHRRFIGHSKDVLSVAFSADNRQIVSGSRDKTINLWNTLGALKYTITADGHEEWVSCVRFSPNLQVPLIVSAGWDKVVKVWNLSNCTLRFDLASEEHGHTGYVSTVAVSPDGSLCASGGKDAQAMLWDLNEGAPLSSLAAPDIIHSLVFSPLRYWLCAATASGIRIWDLESRAKVVEDIVLAQNPNCTRVKRIQSVPIQPVSLAWSGDGETLFAGFTDSKIRVYHVEPATM